VTLRYQSGEEIKKGDCVLFHREPAVIELVASSPDDSLPSRKALLIAPRNPGLFELRSRDAQWYEPGRYIHL